MNCDMRFLLISPRLADHPSPESGKGETKVVGRGSRGMWGMRAGLFGLFKVIYSANTAALGRLGAVLYEWGR